MKKILIVEDDKDFLWLLRQSFNDKSLLVLYAVDGQEGLAMAEKEKPDLILIDILLPNMDGITMARHIKAKGIESQMIFLTNLNDLNHIGKAIEIVGETDYIIKSDVSIDAIVARVKEKLGIT